MDKVSIVLAVYNEERIIADNVRSLLNQEHPDFELEILIVDGGSTDATVSVIHKLIEQYSPGVVRLVKNPKRIAPAAFNLGIQEASGNYVAIFGAHATYQSDYVRVCLQELKRTGAAGCSGKVVLNSKTQNAMAELCLMILTSFIGVSGGSFRTRQYGFVESIPYGIFEKGIFKDVGLYDERLVRNQDNDMNSRILKSGRQLYLTDLTTSLYYPKSTLPALYKYAFNTGLWNAKSLKLGSFTLRLFHFVPFAFLCFNTLLIVMLMVKPVIPPFLITGMLLIFAIYWFVAIAGAIKARASRPLNKFYFPFAVYGFHLSYGAGTFKGLLSKV